MGKVCPPLYGVEDCVSIIDKITKIDEQINELAIERELYVKDLKKKVEDLDCNKDAK